MSQRIRVGFYSEKNYCDKTSFSGVLYHMYHALKEKVEIVNLGKPKKINFWEKVKQKVKKTSRLQTISNLFQYTATELTQEENYRQFNLLVNNQLKNQACDIIFAPVASKALSCFNTKIPIVYLSDATPELIRENYKIYANYSEFNLADEQERKVIAKANKLIYSSEWVANSAIKRYQADVNKIEIIPFGANVYDPPVRELIFSKVANSCCRLIFIGRDWERKGGSIAFDTLKHLLSEGIDAELLMVGCSVPPEIQHPKLTVVGFLNQNKLEDKNKFFQYLLDANFLISPTRGDCSPIVFGDANAYGTPVITTEIGGIPTIIKNGKNGYMLPLSAQGKEYSQIISQVFADKQAYQNLIDNSRKEYDNRLNWHCWAEKMFQIFKDLLEGA